MATIEAANRFLEAWLPSDNRRFTVPPVQATDLHRPKSAGGDLTRLPCIKMTRCLRRDWTVAHHGQLYQVRSTVRATHVIVEDRVDGTMRMTHKGRPLTFQAIVARPLRVAVPSQDRAPAVHGHADTRASVAQAPAAGRNKTRGGGHHINRTVLRWLDISSRYH